MPKTLSFKSFAESSKNPAASAEIGYLQPLDMNFFGMGRSEQLHLAISGVHAFKNQENRYPCDNEEDIAQVIDMAQAINASFKE